MISKRRWSARNKAAETARCRCWCCPTGHCEPPLTIGASMTEANHQDLILDQFTRQATVFSTAPAITDEEALGMIVRAARLVPVTASSTLPAVRASSSARL